MPIDTRPFPAPDLQQALQAQRQAHRAHPMPTLHERLADLERLERFVRDNADDLCRAISEDYGHRSTHETMMLEIVPVVDGIATTRKHLKGWMRVQKREVDVRAFLGARNRVIPQPLGVVGVIVPWNFPVNLSFVPLTAILAAGNRAMVKMSENSRALTRLIQARLPSYFSADKLLFLEETGGVGPAFSALRFDHLLFTGSGATGKQVMAAAAQNLCPVTLELGGQSPAIVCADFPIATAAERISFVKYLNAGQICTTVDHVWLPEGREEAFAKHVRHIVEKRYGALHGDDYSSIIDTRSFERLAAALEEARAGGARLIPLLPGPAWDAATRKINPHVVLEAPPGCALLTREIFGPILPVRPYRDIEDVIRHVNDGPTPLAMYPFSQDEARVRLLIERVMSGGVSVNDALFHVGQHDLPFGGVGESGMGHYHGREGFETFSKMRPVFYQARWPGTQLLYPPYGGRVEKLLAFLMR